jgi:NAD+ synthetase
LQIKEALAYLRRLRGFREELYLQAKCRLLNSYLTNSGLKAVVVGVSGGIDSALTLAIAVRAAKLPDSPIEKITAALLPYLIEEGTSNQRVATDRGEVVVESLRSGCDSNLVDLVKVDLSAGFQVMKSALDEAFGEKGDDWAAGQLVSYLRTPALFYLTSLLTMQDKPAILLGTTNRDEGGYIGYFGKAADAMVDLQLISDLHKSEVISLAEYLHLPQSVIEATPTGDIYDGRTDEELIGVPYEFIEFYSLLLSLRDDRLKAQLKDSLHGDARGDYDEYSVRLDKLNRQNYHKYVAGSTAVHLDVMERPVPGGWRRDLTEDEIKGGMSGGKFVNVFVLPQSIIDQLDNPAKPNIVPQRKPVSSFEDSAFIITDLLGSEECRSFLAVLDKLEWVPVGLNGMLKDYRPDIDPIGSYRASIFNEDLANIVFRRLCLCPDFPRLRIMQENTPADWDGYPVWRAVSVNPLMRFIKYAEGGLLVPHYDAPFDYHEGKRTLMSLVLYLTDSDPTHGGATRLIKDPQIELPLKQRVYEDWTRLARDDEVIASLSLSAGQALLIDHRVLHDSQALKAKEGKKIIMRTDVVFERCGLPRKRSPGISKPLGLPERTGYDN